MDYSKESYTNQHHVISLNRSQLPSLEEIKQHLISLDPDTIIRGYQSDKNLEEIRTVMLREVCSVELQIGTFTVFVSGPLFGEICITTVVSDDSKANVRPAGTIVARDVTISGTKTNAFNNVTQAFKEILSELLKLDVHILSKEKVVHAN